MMFSKAEFGNNESSGNSNNGQLLREIEEISKALKPLPPPTHVRSKSAGKTRIRKLYSSSTPVSSGEDLFSRDKKLSSVWNWKSPLKALAHIRSQKFNCCFYLHVHSIEGLPLNFNDLTLCVHWKRKNTDIQTHFSRVFQGIAEFDETLMHRRSVYASRSGPNDHAKYEPKLFLVYVSVMGVPELDIGKHWIDLTRILPLTFEELGGDKSSGKWTTSLRLVGMAKGAGLNVSFGFSVTRDDIMKLRSNMNIHNINDRVQNKSSTRDNASFTPPNRDVMLQRVGNVPRDSQKGSNLHSNAIDVRICHEVLLNPNIELSKSINLLYQKLDQRNLPSSAGLYMEHVEPPKYQADLEYESAKLCNLLESDENSFTVIEKGIEEVEEDSMRFGDYTFHTIDRSVIEIINVDEIIKGDDTSLEKDTRSSSNHYIPSDYRDEVKADCDKHTGNPCSDRLSMEESELASSGLLTPVQVELDPSLAIVESGERQVYMEAKSNYKAHKFATKSLSLDDVSASVESDFLNMLGIGSGSLLDSGFDGDPQSPRERLLREFEKDTLAFSDSIFYNYMDEVEAVVDCGDPHGNGCAGCDLPSIVQDAEKEDEKEIKLLINRRKAQILEDLETEALMQQWGINERDFLKSPRTSSGGFGSPIELLPEEQPPLLPPLGEGFGPLVRIKCGGFLRSMNPNIFKNAKNSATLVIQASSSVVLPAKMGSDILEILQSMAYTGVEGMSECLSKLMPLPDITGKTMQHIVRDATPSSPERKPLRQSKFFPGCFPYLGKELEESFDDWGHVNLFSEFIDEEIILGCVSPTDISLVTINKIEFLSMEGLRIQCDMSNEGAPSCIWSQSTSKNHVSSDRNSKPGESPDYSGLTGISHENGSSGNVDGLMGLSLTVDEWLRLDAGIIGEDHYSESILKILRAHDAKIAESVGNDKIKVSCRNQRMLGDNLTVAYRVQFRDPHRDNEPVGAPMLVLVQLERVFLHSTQDMIFESKDDQESSADPMQNEINYENIEKTIDLHKDSPQFRFRVIEIHLAGVITKSGERQHCSSTTQKQTGLRWLLASGMGKYKSTKFSSSTSKAIVRYSQLAMKQWQQDDDILWSISSNVRGVSSAPNLHVRNPNVIFPY